MPLSPPTVLYILETDHLGVDADGVLWRRRWPRPVELGPIEDEPGVRHQYRPELAELLEAWRDDGGRRNLERAEWESAFRRQSGVFRGL